MALSLGFVESKDAIYPMDIKAQNIDLIDLIS
jgi:hypothetical protein